MSYISHSIIVQLDNDIAVLPPTLAGLEQVVELSILLTGEVYNDDLEDPASIHYQTLSRQLAEKVSVWLSPGLFMTPYSAALLHLGSCLDLLHLPVYGL